MKDSKSDERDPQLEETVLDELGRNVIIGGADSLPALTPAELQGPHGRRYHATNRELLRNHFPQD